MNLKSILTALFILICAATATARSANERIADAMNRSDWFELESIIDETPKDSIMDFLEVFARCLLGNRLNRPDLSLPAFEELLSTQSENLDLGNLVNSGMMYALDLNHTERNAEAAAVLTSILTSIRPHLDAATAPAPVSKHIRASRPLIKLLSRCMSTEFLSDGPTGLTENGMDAPVLSAKAMP